MTRSSAFHFINQQSDSFGAELDCRLSLLNTRAPLPRREHVRPLKVYEVESCPRWRESLHSTTWVKRIMWPFETLLCWKITFFPRHTGENYLYKQPAVWSKWHSRRRTCFFVPLFVIIEAFQPQLNFWLCCFVTWTSLTDFFFILYRVCVSVYVRDAESWLQTTPRPHALWTGQRAPTAVARSR